MADEIVLQDQLLAKYEAEIGLGQELIHKARILAHQLVEDVLQDGTNLSEGEHVVLALCLCLLVLLGIESKILKWQLCVLWRSSELRQSHVASFQHEIEVCSSTFFVE